MMLPLFLSVALGACTAVRGPVISGSDLAKADPRFSVVPASLALGYSPAPGSRRLFPEAEMDRLTKRFGVEGKARALCFEFAMHKLENKALLAAMEQVIPGASVEILEQSNVDVPEGSLEFSRATLPAPPQSRPDEAVTWRGHVKYAEGRTFTVWVKLRIKVAARRAMAVRDLHAGQEIAPGDIEIRQGQFFPGAEHWAEKAEDVVGRKTLVAVRAGSPFRVNTISQNLDMIARGDQVAVEVEAGAAHLRVDSRAESSAGIGGVVKLRNAKSGKIFEALVTGKGKALVRAVDSIAKEQQ